MDSIQPDGTPAGFNTAVMAEICKQPNKDIDLVQMSSAGRTMALSNALAGTSFLSRSHNDMVLNDSNPAYRSA